MIPRSLRAPLGAAAAAACVLAVASALVPGLARASAVVVDDEGRSFAGRVPARRIVSLAPGATAMLFAAGAGGFVVGTSEYSVEPPAAAGIPRIGDSAGIDLERIVALHPDAVVVWSGGAGAAMIGRLERAGFAVYRHRVVRLDDIAPSIERLGRLAGTDAEARGAARALAARIAALRARATPARAAADDTVLLQVWDRPVYTVGGGQLLSDSLEACGYRNVYGDLHDAGPAVDLESVLARDPATIVALAPSESVAGEWLARWRALPVMRAVRTGRLIGIADQRFTRLGPEVVTATEELCRRLDEQRGR